MANAVLADYTAVWNEAGDYDPDITGRFQDWYNEMGFVPYFQEYDPALSVTTGSEFLPEGYGMPEPEIITNLWLYYDANTYTSGFNARQIYVDIDFERDFGLLAKGFPKVEFNQYAFHAAGPYETGSAGLYYIIDGHPIYDDTTSEIINHLQDLLRAGVATGSFNVDSNANPLTWGYTNANYLLRSIEPYDDAPYSSGGIVTNSIIESRGVLGNILEQDEPEQGLQELHMLPTVYKPAGSVRTKKIQAYGWNKWRDVVVKKKVFKRVAYIPLKVGEGGDWGYFVILGPKAEIGSGMIDIPHHTEVNLEIIPTIKPENKKVNLRINNNYRFIQRATQ